jgi:hypothetical protein
VPPRPAAWWAQHMTGRVWRLSTAGRRPQAAPSAAPV